MAEPENKVPEISTQIMQRAMDAAVAVTPSGITMTIVFSKIDEAGDQVTMNAISNFPGQNFCSDVEAYLKAARHLNEFGKPNEN